MSKKIILTLDEQKNESILSLNKEEDENKPLWSKACEGLKKYKDSDIIISELGEYDENKFIENLEKDIDPEVPLKDREFMCSYILEDEDGEEYRFILFIESDFEYELLEPGQEGDYFTNDVPYPEVSTITPKNLKVMDLAIETIDGEELWHISYDEDEFDLFTEWCTDAEDNIEEIEKDIEERVSDMT